MLGTTRENGRLCWRLPISLLLALGVSLCAQSAGAATYLDLLKKELEAGGGEIDQGGARDGAGGDGADLGASSSADGISQASFETNLKSDHRSTFTLYQRLSAEKKARVVAEYRESKSFEKVTRLVLRLLYGI